MVFQLGAPLLDACVLALLRREETYGYMLTQNIKDIINISESTLYPVLRRLQKEEYLTAHDRPFSGRNRRYYAITVSGRELYETYISEWNEYKTKVDNILKGGESVE